MFEDPRGSAGRAERIDGLVMVSPFSMRSMAREVHSAAAMLPDPFSVLLHQCPTLLSTNLVAGHTGGPNSIDEWPASSLLGSVSSVRWRALGAVARCCADRCWTGRATTPRATARHFPSARVRIASVGEKLRRASVPSDGPAPALLRYLRQCVVARLPRRLHGAERHEAAGAQLRDQAESASRQRIPLQHCPHIELCRVCALTNITSSNRCGLVQSHSGAGGGSRAARQAVRWS